MCNCSFLSFYRLTTVFVALRFCISFIGHDNMCVHLYLHMTSCGHAFTHNIVSHLKAQYFLSTIQSHQRRSGQGYGDLFAWTHTKSLCKVFMFQKATSVNLQNLFTNHFQLRKQTGCLFLECVLLEGWSSSTYKPRQI